MRVRRQTPAFPASQSLSPHEAGAPSPAHALIGESAAFLHVLSKVRQYARYDGINVLFEGERGTGKTLLAHHLHAVSARGRGPFVRIDLGLLDEGTASSELFGHIRGAFTDAVAETRGLLAEANGGTVFLDELQHASLAVQKRLLRVCEDHVVRPVGAARDVPIDVRVIGGANVPLSELVAQRRFLPDLAARLSGGLIRVPPLCDRRADIPLLIHAFVVQSCRGRGYEVPPKVHPLLMVALMNAPWPENIRGLWCVTERLMIENAPAPVLGLEHCVDDLAFLRLGGWRGKRPPREVVEAALKECGGKRDLAARQLGVSRATFYRALREPVSVSPRRRSTDGEIGAVDSSPNPARDSGRRLSTDAPERDGDALQS